LVPGRVDNGSDVRLLGRVCVERWGAPGRLAGLHCRLERPGKLGRFGWATREWRKGEGKRSGWPGRAQLLAEFLPTAE
jgi:hypothetical protein